MAVAKTTAYCNAATITAIKHFAVQARVWHFKIMCFNVRSIYTQSLLCLNIKVAMTNTLAYYNTATIAAVKSFVVQTQLWHFKILCLM